jgi:hypothetical protein
LVIPASLVIFLTGCLFCVQVKIILTIFYCALDVLYYIHHSNLLLDFMFLFQVNGMELGQLLNEL